MTEQAVRKPPQRRDAARNRALLLDAAREIFGTLGPDAPFEEIARVAGVSRTTLYRNFATREELAATVYEDNVRMHEEFARSLAGAEAGIVTYFQSILDSMRRNVGITRVMMGSGVEFAEISARMNTTYEKLLREGRKQGIVRPGVGIKDIHVALRMADTCFAQAVASGRPLEAERVSRLLRTALFTIEG